MITLTHHCPRHHMQDIAKLCKTVGLLDLFLDLRSRVLPMVLPILLPMVLPMVLPRLAPSAESHWGRPGIGSSALLQHPTWPRGRRARDSWHSALGVPEFGRNRAPPWFIMVHHASSSLQKLPGYPRFRHKANWSNGWMPQPSAHRRLLCLKASFACFTSSRSSKALVSLDTACHRHSDPNYTSSVIQTTLILLNQCFKLTQIVRSRQSVHRVTKRAVESFGSSDQDRSQVCLQGLFPVVNGKATSNLQNGL